MANPNLNPIAVANIYAPEDDFYKSDKGIFVKQAYVSASKITKRMTYNFIDENNQKKIKVLGLNTSYLVGQTQVNANIMNIRVIYDLVIYHIPSVNIAIDKNAIVTDVFYLTITAVPNNNDVTFKITAMTKQEYDSLVDENTNILLYVTSSDIVTDSYAVESTDQPVQTTPKYYDEHQIYTYRVFMNGIKLVENMDYILNINII